MFDKIKEMNRLRKLQADMKKQLEGIFSTYSKGNISVVVRGDRRVEKILIDDEENKVLKDVLNEAMKELDKKVEKQMRGKLSELGIPGL